ncbi:MAG TPA: hypothetical protein VHS59_09345 [Bacillota bacterium]|nr:hypothetical protein [Bacillota bacterium]
MASNQQIQQCIDQCTQAANQLRTTANGITSAAAREMATLGAGHIEMCIRSCEKAMSK